MRGIRSLCQAHVVRTLKNAVSSGRVAHAYLFSGPRGVGKTTAARILAKCLNCESGPTSAPCNRCSACRSIAGGSSVDVFEIDGASNTSVDNIRELRESVRYVPSQGRYKVYIIDEVHMLSGSAFNALLKTLEEPPAHAVFIFATTEVHKIPLTILSRCQRFDFKRIPFREIQQHLRKIVTEEGIKFEDKALFTLAREADGSLRDAQSLLEQVLAFAGGGLKDSDCTEALGLMDRSVLYSIAEAIISKNAAECLNIVEKIYDFGYDLKRGCGNLLELIRDLTVIKVTGDTALLDLPDSELERARALAGNIGVQRLQMLFSIISRGYEEVSRSAFPRYALEMALVKAAHFDEIEPVGELISRLESLGRAGKAAAPTGAPAAGEARMAAPVKRAEAGALPASAPQARERDAEYAAEAADAQERDMAAGPASLRPDGIAAHVGKKDAELAGILGSVGLNLEGDVLNITAGGRLGAKLAIKKGLLEAACREFYGRAVDIRINGMGGSAARKKTEADPLIKDALKILGGRVVEDRRRSNV
ncbi:MAG: DNA polymerase III subunit gamma/tau [Deltaproteobacteria bacterium]|nr:DNA polymerase III subunit gamma/tau [Deltaproteobacteria bacterium]